MAHTTTPAVPDAPVVVSRATNADILQTIIQMRLDMNTTFARLIEQVKQLSERVAKLEAKVDAHVARTAEQETQNRLARRTVERLEDENEALEQRVRDLENARWYAWGFGAAAGVLGSVVWELVVHRLF